MLRAQLGAQLRRLREARGVTREQAGQRIRASESKISRMELGRVGCKERDVADLLTLYGVLDERSRGDLLALAREANTPGWWHSYADVLPPWFRSYVGLEAAASLIRTYEAQFVPGLLQTAEYARAVIARGCRARGGDEVDRRVRFRMARQELLTVPDAPRLWAVVDEAVLHRPVGDPGVMRRQLQALVGLAAMPNVTLQVVPFSAGGHVTTAGAFSILRFDDLELPDTVYTEHLTGAQYLDGRDDVTVYAESLDRLCVHADPPTCTLRALRRVLSAMS